MNNHTPNIAKRIAMHAIAIFIFGMAMGDNPVIRADTTPLTMLDPNLQAEVLLNTGIAQPIGIVFLAANDYLVLERASGQIKRVINNVIQPQPVLDLAVNSNSERGLLSMVLNPNFPTDPSVYIRWTRAAPAPTPVWSVKSRCLEIGSIASSGTDRR
jgi:glucose/arabinose dehydrogenase